MPHLGAIATSGDALVTWQAIAVPSCMLCSTADAIVLCMSSPPRGALGGNGMLGLGSFPLGVLAVQSLTGTHTGVSACRQRVAWSAGSIPVSGVANASMNVASCIHSDVHTHNRRAGSVRQFGAGGLSGKDHRQGGPHLFGTCSRLRPCAPSSLPSTRLNTISLLSTLTHPHPPSPPSPRQGLMSTRLQPGCAQTMLYLSQHDRVPNVCCYHNLQRLPSRVLVNLGHLSACGRGPERLQRRSGRVPASQLRHLFPTTHAHLHAASSLSTHTASSQPRARSSAAACLIACVKLTHSKLCPAVSSMHPLIQARSR